MKGNTRTTLWFLDRKAAVKAASRGEDGERRKSRVFASSRRVEAEERGSREYQGQAEQTVETEIEDTAKLRLRSPAGWCLPKQLHSGSISGGGKAHCH